MALLRQGFAFDEALEALQLLAEHPVDPRRPLLHAAADIAAEDIAQGDAGAALSRFQRPAERAVDALRLQRAERGAQTQSLARRGVDDLQMPNRAAIPPTRGSIAQSTGSGPVWTRANGHQRAKSLANSANARSGAARTVTVLTIARNSNRAIVIPPAPRLSPRPFHPAPHATSSRWPRAARPAPAGWPHRAAVCHCAAR
jgi:hypothetical protein